MTRSTMTAIPGMRRRHERPEIVGGAVILLDRLVIRDVVAEIARGFGDRHEPQGGDAQVRRCLWVAVVEVVQLPDEPAQIADAVAIGISEASDERFVEDAVAPPFDGTGRRRGGHSIEYGGAPA